MQTDHIDVYYAHHDDPDTPLEETVAAFDDLVKRGLVRHVGLSNFTAERIQQWLDVATASGAALPVPLQPHYNMLVRADFERNVRGRQLTVTGFAGLRTPLREKRDALTWLWARLIHGDLRIDVRTFSLEQLPAAWAAQAASPHAKCVVLPNGDLPARLNSPSQE